MLTLSRRKLRQQPMRACACVRVCVVDVCVHAHNLTCVFAYITTANASLTQPHLSKQHTPYFSVQEGETRSRQKV